MKKRYIVGAIVAGAILVFFWSRFTYGFEEPLTPVASIAIILYIAFVIETFAFALLLKKTKSLQKYIDEIDVEGLQETEKKYHKIVNERDKLLDDLADIRGKILLSGHEELLSDAPQKKSKTTKKKKARVEPDTGVVRVNKEKLAYKLKCEGKTRQQIADAIGLSVSSVSKYVSRGKKAAEGEK